MNIDRYIIEDYDLDISTIRSRLEGYSFGYVSKQKVDGLSNWPLPNCKKYTDKFPDGEPLCANLINEYKTKNGIEPSDDDLLLGEVFIQLFIRGDKYDRFYVCYKDIPNAN